MIKIKNLSATWKFLIIITLIYFGILIFNSKLFLTSLNFATTIFLEIIPVFIIIFILMTLSNYFITPEFIIKHLKRKGFKKWFFVVIAGILSSGPIYMWYPLLGDLKKKGLSNGLIACFLYNRAIKIPLLPIAISYFNLKYILILTLVMIIFSIIQGILINKLMKVTPLKTL
ncbi:MAG: hypothetical protein U9Q99_03035 [Nanoarchaeota archaeon]|nr:hypothetical protein [Nanoarchaeota archaeon]